MGLPPTQGGPHRTNRWFGRLRPPNCGGRILPGKHSLDVILGVDGGWRMFLDRRQLAWVAAAALACVGVAFVCAPRSGLPHLTPPDCVFERMVTGWVSDEGASSAGGTVLGAQIELRASGGKGRTRKRAGRPEWAIPFGDEFWRRSSPIQSDAIPPDDARAVVSPVKVSDAVERVTYAFCQEGANSLLQVRGRGYQASVTDGLEFVAFSPEAGEPSTAARFYTRSIRREIGDGGAKDLGVPIGR